MLKVIIADDEPRICRLIHMLADWHALNMEVVGTAENGLEALELITAWEPDILITDIRMPGCDGLALVSQAKKRFPQLQVVIISGYAQFEYAQTAIRCGVGDYLLKPIQKDALMATLETLRGRCEGFKVQTKPDTAQPQGEGSECLEVLHGRLLEDLLQGRLRHLTHAQLMGQYGFPVGEEIFQIYILRLDYTAATCSDAALENVQKKIKDIFNPALANVCAAHTLCFSGAAGYGIMNFSKEQSREIRRILRRCLNEIQVQTFFFGTISFTLALGHMAEHAAHIPISLDTAHKAVAQRIVEGTGKLLEYTPPEAKLKVQPLLDKYGQTVVQALDTLRIETSDRAVEELFHTIGTLPHLRGYEIMETTLSAGRLFIMHSNAEQEAELFQSLEANCQQCKTLKELQQCLCSFQAKQMQLSLDRLKNDASRPIRIAKDYIQKNYATSITLEEVCQAVGFSTSYFSTMFKRETGEGFSKYLTRVRIEQAKTLLQDTSLPVTEICHQVGYSDVKHFKHTFKKITNLNPGQYRTLYG